VELRNAVASGNIPQRERERERERRRDERISEENRWKCFKCTATLRKMDGSHAGL